MKTDPHQEPKSDENKPFLPRWFVICVSVLVALVIVKSLGLQIYIEFKLDGEPFVAGLTDIEFYLVPLSLLGVYFLWCWVWDKFFGFRDA